MNFKAILGALALALSAAFGTSPAFAQGAIQQAGPAIPGHLCFFVRNGQCMDAGGPLVPGGAVSNSALPGSRPTGVGFVMSGQGLGLFSNYATGPFSQILMGYDGSGNALFTVGSVGGSGIGCTWLINGASYNCATLGGGNIVGPLSSTVGHLPIFNSTVGQLLSDSGILASNVVQGPASAITMHVAIFADGTGKLLSDSGVILGTIASQNANAVNITGGTISGTLSGTFTGTGSLTGNFIPAVRTLNAVGGNILTTDCGQTVSLTGTTLATINFPAPAGFTAGCKVHLSNDDPFSGGRARFITVTNGNLGNLTLYPGQSVDFVNRNSVWVEENAPGRWRAPGAITFFVDPASGNDTTGDGLASGYGSGAFQTVLVAWNTCRDFTDGICGIQVKPGSTITGGIGELDGDHAQSYGKLIGINGDCTLANPVTVTLAAPGIDLILRDGAWASICGFHWSTTVGGSVGISAQQDSLADLGKNIWDQFPTGGSALLIADKADANIIDNQTITGNGASSASWASVSLGAKLIIGTVTFNGSSATVNYTTAFIIGDQNGRISFQTGITFSNFGSYTGKRYQLTNQSMIALNGLTLPGNAAGTYDASSVVVGQVNSGATLQANPGNPTGTTALTPKMMGIGTATCVLTPIYSTRVALSISGNLTNGTTADGAAVQIYYGSGTAPANGATATGTPIGAQETLVNTPNTTFEAPFSSSVVITGLTPGVAEWFDLGLEALTGGTASVTNLACSAHEFF